MRMNLSKLWAQRRTEKPGMLQPMGSQRVGHDLATEQQKHTQTFSACSALGKAEALIVPRIRVRMSWSREPGNCFQALCLVLGESMITCCMSEWAHEYMWNTASSSERADRMVCMCQSKTFTLLLIQQGKDSGGVISPRDIIRNSLCTNFPFHSELNLGL